jgi:hypothetical protein
MGAVADATRKVPMHDRVVKRGDGDRYRGADFLGAWLSNPLFAIAQEPTQRRASAAGNWWAGDEGESRREGCLWKLDMSISAA